MEKSIGDRRIAKWWSYIFLLFFFCIPLQLVSAPLAWAVLYFGIGIMLVKKTPVSSFPVVLFLLALVSRVFVVSVLKTPPESDFEMMYQASLGICKGDFSFLETDYFRLWPYQTGFVYFQSILLRIWNNILILKLFNCLMAAGTVVLVYLIALEFCDKNAASLASLLYCFLPYPLFFVSVLSNQFASSFLIYLGLYLLITDRISMHTHIRHAVFALLLVLSNILRPEGLVPLVALTLYLLITANKSNLRQNIVNLALVLGIYFAASKLISALFAATGLSPLGLSKSDPLWKFVLGLNHETGGTYAVGDEPLLGNREAELRIIKERLAAPVSAHWALLREKIETFWGKYPLSWSFNYCMSTGIPMFGRSLYIADDMENMHQFTKHIMTAMYWLAGGGTFLYMRQKKGDHKILLIVNQVFVTFGVYLLIEVQARYSYYVQPCIFILAALAFSILNRKREKQKTVSQTDMKGVS